MKQTNNTENLSVMSQTTRKTSFGYLTKNTSAAAETKLLEAQRILGLHFNKAFINQQQCGALKTSDQASWR